MTPTSRRGGRRSGRHTWVARLGLLAAVGVACASAAPAAHAEFGLEPNTEFELVPDDVRAGAHPNVDVRFQVAHDPLTGYADGGLRDVVVDLPRGVMSSPAGFAQCRIEDFIESATTLCPKESIVGGIEAEPATFGIPWPVFLLESPKGAPARLGFSLATFVSVPIDISIRNGTDYGITASLRSVPRLAAVNTFRMRLFGVPADNPDYLGAGFFFGPRSDARRPFMINPTSCAGSPKAKLTLRSYEVPAQVKTYTADWPQPTNCDSVPFGGTANVSFDTDSTDTPTGLTVDLGIPQNDDPDGRAASALKDIAVTLPEGVGINPPIARGLEGCTDAQFAKNANVESSCPPSSKIGQVTLDVPLLPEPLAGDVYLATPAEGNPYRLFLYAPGQGVRVKLEGNIVPNRETGRITASFYENPQVPVRRISMRLRGGPNATLVMPQRCGPMTTSATFVPWSGNPGVTATSQSFLNAAAGGGECVDTLPFQPQFTAGTADAGAGKDTPFVLQFGRPDGHEELRDIGVHLPAGLLGRLTAVPLCPGDLAAAGACGDESRVGSVRASAGSGASPLTLPGKVWLAEPHRAGDIASLAILVPAQVGPFDLGNVVVRAGIKVNRDTSLSVQSEPFPTMLQGVPLRIKQILMELDFPGFMFNPTDCSPKTITGTVTSISGREAAVGSPFGVEGCSKLPFAPAIEMQTTAPAPRTARAGLKVTIRPRPGDANMRVVNLILPSGLGARLDGPIQTPCLSEELGAGACPEASRVGRAIARTPVLPAPLTGQVHLLENESGGGLPRLAILLRGAVDIDLVGDITVNRQGRILAEVPGVPDVPISEFVLDLESGDHAALAGANLCRNRLVADRHMIAHSGAQIADRVPVSITGCNESASSKSKGSKSKGSKSKGKKKKAKKKQKGSRTAR